MGRRPIKWENPQASDTQPSASGTSEQMASASNSMDSLASSADTTTGDGGPGKESGSAAAQKAGSSDGQVVSADGSLQVLGRGVKELVQAIQVLRQLGVEELDLPLPKIVVVGDQSTGKSSLIEGMSEIKVPRSAGTCTRCPLEINLTESSTPIWSCKVFLCKKYVYDGLLGVERPTARGFRKSEGATRDRPLGPWVPQDLEEQHFATITRKDQVPGVLFLAQLATLNPGTTYEAYMPGERPAPSDALQVKFSPNVIRLDISGPGLPNLAFYDLPGVINVSDVAEEHYLVNLVRNLVKEYVQGEDSINLLAIPMTDDPANSSASRLIRELKAESRTLGCLTKPDRRQEGESMDQWLQILRGERFSLGHGYYVIKNDPDPNVDHAIARANEEAYFGTVLPWSTLLHEYSQKFGTRFLQTALSQKLTSQIRRSLPLITARVRDKALSIDAQIRELPEPPHGNLPAIALGELLKFKDGLNSHLEGGKRNHPFQKEWNEIAMCFRRTLADTKPLLTLPTPRSVLNSSTPSTLTPGSGSSQRAGPITIDSDDDEMPTLRTSNQGRTGSKRPTASTQSTPVKSQRTESSASDGLGPSMYQSKRFSVAEVRSILQDTYSGGLLNLIHPEATEQMIQMSMAHWDGPLQLFLEKTERLCENVTFEQVQQGFHHRCGTRFYDEILETCRTTFKRLFDEQRALCKRILCWELGKPKTLDEDALEAASGKAFNILQAGRRDARVNETLNDTEAKTGKATTGLARAKEIAKFPDSQLPPDVYERELRAMSVVKGYYECAYSRFVDVACSSIFCELFGKCRTDLHTAMMDKFDVTSPDAYQRFAVLFAANPRDESRRAQLLREKEVIMKAQERLQSIQ